MLLRCSGAESWEALRRAQLTRSGFEGRLYECGELDQARLVELLDDELLLQTRDLML